MGVDGEKKAVKVRNKIAVFCVVSALAAACHTGEIVGPGPHWVVDSETGSDTEEGTSPFTENDTATTSDTWSDVPSDLFLHLDATAEDSVLTDGQGVVVQWTDLSSYGHHATPSRGKVLYPSASVSESGLPGLDFGFDLNELQLLDVTENAALLDFSDGNAGEKTGDGLTVFIAFKVYEIPNNQMFLLGTRDNRGDFSLKINRGGRIVATLLDTYDAHGPARIRSGDTIVAAMSYDATTGYCRVWESKNGLITDEFQPTQGDLDANVDLRLGEVRPVDGSVSFFRGMIGEVKIFHTSLEDEAFEKQQQAFVAKWGTAIYGDAGVDGTN